MYETIFLDNHGAVTSGRKYIRIRPGSRLYIRSGDTFTQTPTEVGKDIHAVLPEDKCPPEECGGKKYYRIGEGSWLNQDDVEALNQYDLKQRGFSAFVQDSTPDMLKSLTEKWVQSTFEAYSEQVVPERGIQQRQMSDFYKAMAEKLDSDKDGELSGQELYSAVHHAELGIRDIAARMTVKHVSEWSGGSRDPKWTKFFETYDPLRIGFTKKWLDDMEWMSQVEPFSSGQAVWHMHPVVFLDALIRKSKITKEMLRKIWTDSARVPDALLNAVAEELSASFERCRINTSNRLNHFMAQVFQEVGPGFNLNENFNYRPNVLVAKFAYYANHVSEAEADGFIPGRQAANAENIANKAYANRVSNGGYESGDGWRYRGRGMKQLTFRGNYRSFTRYHENKWGQKIDFEAEPDLLLETVYAVRSALYFWDFNNLPSRADQGVTKDVSYSITRIVNQYDNHYDDRFENLKRLLREGVFNEAF